MSLSSKYDQLYGSGFQTGVLSDHPVRRWPRNRVEAIIAVPGTGESILDVGCGDGNLLYQFRSRYSRLVGLEYSEARLALASRNLSSLNFQGLLGSAENMAQLPDNCVDRIVSADVIEHVPDVYAACSEMHRILKPGGFLIINTPNIAFIKKRLILAFGKFPSTSQPNEGIGDAPLFDGGHLHYFTYRSLRLVLERTGFQIIRRMGFGRFHCFHAVYPPLTSGGVQWIVRKSG